ncbi:MAG TPA: DUF3108 domain-containing protein [Gemmatimonadaceae bacterium]|nr:DUF3108 domain-containing protein [Gemmatimonadaceae bacterium]
MGGRIRSSTRAVLLAAASALSVGIPSIGGAQKAPLERAEYQLKVGVISAGSGVMEVLGREVVDGHDTYHAVLSIEGGVGPAKVEDRFESWGDAAAWNDQRNVFSRRFVQDQRELGKRRQRTYELFPERKQYRRADTGETLALPTDEPLDDVSMLYFARSLPLKVGDTYTINRYFKADANPIVLRVVRRETVTVPAGTFQTVVVRPTIKTSGLFGEGGEAELFFSDDQRHLLVQMRSKVPIIGSLSLHLRRYVPPTDAGVAPSSPRR